MPTSTKVKNLNINELTEAQYDAAVQGGVIGVNELSVLTDVDYVEPSDLATVATTGDYSDLINRPTNLVSTNTAQTISGMKTFSGDITLSGTTSIKNNTGGTNYTMLYRDASTIHVGASTSALKLEGSGTRPAYNNDSLALLSDITGGLPSQTGHSGEFLTTDGTDASWAAVDALPSQTGHSGEFLTTDGTDASWATVDALPSQTGYSGRVLGTDGFVAGWVEPEIVQRSAMPVASQDEEGNIYQFIGTTDANYTHGYFYECVSDGGNPATYSWSNVQVQASSGGLPTQTGQSGKFLTTDGTDASWASVDTLPSASGHNNQLLWVSYGTPSWSNRTYVSDGKTMFGRQEGAQNGNGFAVGMYYKLNPGSGYPAIAIGGTSPEALAPYVIAMGVFVRADAVGAIQIGTGNSTSSMAVNSDAGTMNVALKKSLNDPAINVKLLDSDGTIPTARLTKVNTTVTLAAADWSSNTQTVSVTGMTATGVVLVSPDPTDQSAYTSAGIICSAQAAGTLTFTCSTTPSADLSVNVVML